MYEGILEGGAPAFESVLRHMKDHPDAPCVIHCTGSFWDLYHSFHSTERAYGYVLTLNPHIFVQLERTEQEYFLPSSSRYD